MENRKLKGKLRELGKTYQEASEMLDISLVSFNSKINGNNQFTILEAEKLCNWLGLNEKERVEIFLPLNFRVNKV